MTQCTFRLMIFFFFKAAFCHWDNNKRTINYFYDNVFPFKAFKNHKL